MADPWDDELDRRWQSEVREQNHFVRVLLVVLVILVVCAVALVFVLNAWNDRADDVVGLLLGQQPR